MTTVLAIIGGLATITGAVYGIFKWFAWKFQTTPEESQETIAKQVADQKQAVDDEFKKEVQGG